ACMTTSLIRRRITILLAALVSIISISFEMYADSRPPVVRESDMRARISGDGILVMLPTAIGPKSLEARLAIDLVDTTGGELASATSSVRLQRGDNAVSVHVSWPGFANESDWEERRDMLMWTRVRYRLTTNAPENCAASEVTGTRALGPAVEGFFTLRSIVPWEPGLGAPVHVRVFAENPFTGAPVPGVHIDESLVSKDDDEKS